MLKRDITYENVDGETVTESFYFNLTKTEIIDLQFGVTGGLEKSIQRIIETKDIKAVVDEIKNIILSSYGVRDGNRFIKSNAIREEFIQILAYDALFMELMTNEEAAADFIKGITPKDMQEAIAQGEKDLKALNVTPPLPPAS
jgi:hypothetical protein